MKKQWWHDKVAYQIYPRTFADSNNDGIGDIQGIISKLDYLKDLGIDILWLSPVYQSPMADQGYDISDYRDINPMFGTMEDIEELIREVKKRDMYLLMDLVVNHCSDQHEWFKKAVEDPYGEYGKYFYIKECKDGKLPNNWRAEFGGSVWTPLPGHEDLYYYHTFAKEQPDLNWENPRLREEVYRMINWWLDKGIDGFRIDAIINIKKNLTWQSYPADNPDGTCSHEAMLKDAKGIGEFLNELKEKCFKPANALTIGEVFNINPSRIKEFIGEDGYFSTMFSFDPFFTFQRGKYWYQWKHLDFQAWRDAVFKNQLLVQDMAFEVNILENHDQPRGATIFIPEEDYGFYSVSALAAIFMLLRGLPFLYQGQETGTRNRVFHSPEEFDDVSTKDQYLAAKKAGLSDKDALEAAAYWSRDNARGMICWDEMHQQEEEYGSVLNYYKRLIAFRKSEEYRNVLTEGKFAPAYEDESRIFSYFRYDDRTKLLLISNYSNQTAELEVKEKGEVVFVNYPQVSWQGERLVLRPYQTVVLDVKDQTI